MPGILKQAMIAALYGFIFLNLLLVDYVLGNGFVAMTHRVFCKIFCFVKKTIKEETKFTQTAGQPISVPILIVEVFTLLLTIYILQKYKQYHCRDRIDELLNESKEALRQTNEFLEKWRLRRVIKHFNNNCLSTRDWKITWQGSFSENSYLDEEPQIIKPLNLELPILHMALVDTLGTTRSQPERGDAGDLISVSDSTLLNVTSFLENDFRQLSSESISDEPAIESYVFEDQKMEFPNRLLWDVVEEDSNQSD